MEQLKGESRINYLVRVLNELMTYSIAGEETIIYDGVICDGKCLASDIAAELNIILED